MKLNSIIEEQSIFNFSGMINVLLDNNNQFLGSIVLKEGKIINAHFEKWEGKKALLNIVMKSIDMPEKLKYIIEPELISDEAISCFYSFEEYLNFVHEIKKQVEIHKRYRPARDLKLTINGAFIDQGESINSDEFDVLCTISDYSKIEEIYKFSVSCEFDITNSLISLRKKGALKVVSSN